MANSCNNEKCKKKIPLIEWKCKCGGKFCTKHRLPEQHKCTWDYKMNDEEREKKIKSLKCENNKFESLTNL
jgi:predicted nucleic acid binding AN1-type Zn finger protein